LGDGWRDEKEVEQNVGTDVVSMKEIKRRKLLITPTNLRRNFDLPSVQYGQTPLCDGPENFTAHASSRDRPEGIPTENSRS